MVFRKSALAATAAVAATVCTIAVAAGPTAKLSREAPPAIKIEAHRSPALKQKVLVYSVRAALSAGVQPADVIDYGGFAQIEVDPAEAAQLIEQGVATNADGHNLILFNVGALDTTSPRAAEIATMGAPKGDGKRLHVVQFPGPIKSVWVERLEATGAQIVDYLPANAYLVYGDADARSAVSALVADGTAQWSAAYLDEFKLQPDTAAHATEWSSKSRVQAPLAAPSNLWSVQLVRDPQANARTQSLISAATGRAPVSSFEIKHYVNLVVEVPAHLLTELAKQPDVISIAPYDEPVRMDERQNMIVAGNLTGNVPNTGNYFNLLNAWGFNQAQFNSSGFVVDVTDDGADRNPGPTAPGTIAQDANTGPVPANHFVLYTGGSTANASRFIYKGRWGTASTGDAGQGVSGHGQLNMSIVGGFVPDGLGTTGDRIQRDDQGFRYGLGVAPYVRMANSVIFDPNFTNPNFSNMISGGYAQGMRISTNSWGNTSNAYGANAQTYDILARDGQAATAGNQQVLLLFAAGNGGSGSNTVGNPGTGKNVITVGAAENAHPHAAANGGNAGNTTGADGCNTPDTGADSANDIIDFSSRGPTSDGRVKPDIVAPGTHVTGMTYVMPGSTGNGTAMATYRADGVCAMPTANTTPANRFFPVSSGQQWWSTSSGTSHSTPALAGGAALVYQQFINNPAYIATHRVPAGSAPPSPAMAKAYLVNSARYMTGVSANDTLPSNNQGMGMMNLGTAFDGTTRIIRDQVPADVFGDTGQSRTLFATVTDATKPVRITLAWTDKEGSTTGNAFVNNLDLRVTAGGSAYLGNRFGPGGASVTGGTADIRNNLESVFIPAGLPVGTVLAIRVGATNIAGDGVPGNADTTDQDYALVVYNAQPGADQAVVELASTALPTDNGIVEPNECNTFVPTLGNGGTLAATGVTSTLTTSTLGVTISQANSAYADIAPAATVAPATPFQISTANTVACGTTINLTQTVTYSGTGSPVVLPMTLRVGQPANPNYTLSPVSGTFPTGTLLVTGTSADDAVGAVTAPFAFSLYGNPVAVGAAASVSTNGNIQFVAGGSTEFSNTALPAAIFGATVPVLMPYWDDLHTGRVAGHGIYQATTGTAPNRQWVIEWRGQHFNGDNAASGTTLNFSVVFTEGQDGFLYHYNTVGGAAAGGSSATVGVQAANSGTNFTQFSANSPSLTAGLRLNAARAPGICNPGPATCGSLDTIFNHGFEGPSP